MENNVVEFVPFRLWKKAAETYEDQIARLDRLGKDIEELKLEAVAMRSQMGALRSVQGGNGGPKRAA